MTKIFKGPDRFREQMEWEEGNCGLIGITGMWACKGFVPITNADRIRSMSDEELAEYLDGVCHDLWQMFVKDPQKMWLDWLKQEVKDD